MANTIWKLGATGKIEGSRTKVREIIASDKSTPEPEKTYLIAKIDSRPAEHNWVIITAHACEVVGKSVLDLDVESSTENI